MAGHRSTTSIVRDMLSETPGRLAADMIALSLDGPSLLSRDSSSQWQSDGQASFDALEHNFALFHSSEPE